MVLYGHGICNDRSCAVWRPEWYHMAMEYVMIEAVLCGGLSGTIWPWNM